MNLTQIELGKERTIRSISTHDNELEAFLFSLGCFEGEKITVISRRKSGSIVAIKDGRYNIDTPLAQAIEVF